MYLLESFTLVCSYLRCKKKKKREKERNLPEVLKSCHSTSSLFRFCKLCGFFFSFGDRFLSQLVETMSSS